MRISCSLHLVRSRDAFLPLEHIHKRSDEYGVGGGLLGFTTLCERESQERNLVIANHNIKVLCAESLTDKSCLTCDKPL